MKKENKIVGLPEEYIVKCDTNLQTSEVVSKITGDKYDSLGLWEYVICKLELIPSRSGKLIEHTIRDEFKHLPVFSYNEWTKLKDIKNMNKVEAPKTFAIKSDSKHLLKACWEELKEMGYVASPLTINREPNDFITTNINNFRNKDEYIQIHINANLILGKKDLVFTLPQDYTKAIEYAKSAINSEYWNQSKVTKLNFGEVEFTIESGKDYAKTAYGRVTKEEIRKAIEYIENPPRLTGYILNIFSPGRRTDFSMLDNTSDVSYGFGCKSGKLSELKSIYKAFEN